MRLIWLVPRYRTRVSALGMPGVSGNELARQVRPQPQTAHLLLVAVTGYGQQAYLGQMSQSAPCNRLHNIDVRFFHWIPLPHDRVKCNEFHLMPVGSWKKRAANAMPYPPISASCWALVSMFPGEVAPKVCSGSNDGKDTPLLRFNSETPRRESIGIPFANFRSNERSMPSYTEHHIPAGAPIVASFYGNVGAFACHVKLAFTPEAGSDYEASFSRSIPGCQLSIQKIQRSLSGGIEQVPMPRSGDAGYC